ncbi:MAG: hypothetical protein KC478_03950 [Bacteriovoracaceae bacterium]|nr:hypothetical protein [Bacteriovoracaceae bacterium]
MKKFLGLGLALIFSAGCGDLFMGEKDKESISLQAFTCDFDTKAFSKILEHNIKGDIVCLQEKIHSFIDLVKTDRPGYISEKTLVKFVENGPMDFGDNNLGPVIEGIFELTQLILGGDRGYISRADFDRFIAFLIEFNRNIFPVYDIFTNENELNWGDYDRNRKIVRKYLVVISQEIRHLLNLNRSGLDQMDIEVFLSRFFYDEPDVASQIKSLMWLKRTFLGGDELSLSHVELDNALVKLPELGEVAYDLVKMKSFGFKDDAQSMIDDVYLKDIETLRRNLHFGADSYEALFTVYDVLNSIRELDIDLGIDLTAYPQEIMKIKGAILGSQGEFFSSIELVTLLDHLSNILDEGSFFYRVYAKYQDELNSTDPLTNDFSDFLVHNSREERFLNHFSDIANNYRFFKGDYRSPYYSFEHYRNPLAIFEISAIEYVVKLLMSEYGAQNEGARGGYHMTLVQTTALMEDLKRFLRDQGILNIGKSQGGEVQGVADNMVLMSTLFQYQSNGCDDYVCMEVPEATEFIVSLITALSVKDFFTEEMQKLCFDQVDEFGRIYPDCFRKNFVNVLETPNPDDEYRSLSDYMPLLSSYIVELTDHLPDGASPTESEEYVKFITETEAFTRTCMFYDEEQTEPVPLKGNDAFAVFAGMLNVESTLLKFDKNQNNKLDGFGVHNEVLDAYYTTYEGAIQALVAEQAGPFLTRFSRHIFQYLIKFGKVPETDSFGNVLSFAKFLIRLNKNADATRTTISTILKVLAQQNAGDNYFKCDECMRDPNVQCVPVSCYTDRDSGEVVCEDSPWE